MRVVAARVDDGDFDTLSVDRAVELGLEHELLSPTEEGPCVVAGKSLAEGTQPDDVERIVGQFDVADDQVPIIFPGFGHHRLRMARLESVEGQFNLPVLIADPFRRQAGPKNQNLYFRQRLVAITEDLDADLRRFQTAPIDPCR